MENFQNDFQNDIQNEKVGGGIIAISVIYFVINFFAILGLLSVLVLKDTINEAAAKSNLTNVNIELSTVDVFLSILFIIVLFTSLILILRKKAIGVYMYFGYVVVNLIYSIIVNGFGFSTITSLVLPTLMGICISKRKHIFGL